MDAVPRNVKQKMHCSTPEVILSRTAKIKNRTIANFGISKSMLALVSSVCLIQN